jgi:peptide/nickel transport system substrate-binding protein
MRKSRYARLAIAGLATVATTIALAACSGGGSTPDDTSSSSSAPKSGGTATLIEAAALASWDPTVQAQGTIPGVSTDRYIAVYGDLLYVDTKNQLQGDIAKSLTSKDDTTWTLVLNKGVTFSDGTPLDADAVKFNWDRAARDGSSVKALASTMTTTVVDETTVKVTLKEANPLFARQVTESLNWMLSPKSVQEQGDDYTKPVGAGPFTLVSSDQATGEKLKRNPDYFKKGQPYLDNLNLSIIVDPAQRVTTVAQGGADSLNNYRFAILDSIDTPNTSVAEVKSGGLRMVIMNNTEASPFHDIRLRQAAALAIDPTDLVQTLTQDPSQKSSTGLFPTSSPFYDKRYALEENDQKEAKKLVAEAKADGVSTDVNLNIAVVPELVRSAELLQLQLNKVGFNATITQTPLGDWRAKITTQKDYDISFYPGIFDLNNAQVQFTALFQGIENLSQYHSADMDAAIEKVQASQTQAEQKAAFSGMQKVWQKDTPFIVFGTDNRIFFHQDRLQGFTPTGRGALLMENLYVTDGK